MASASYHISNLLEKMTSSDKDFRYNRSPADTDEPPGSRKHSSNGFYRVLKPRPALSGLMLTASLPPV